MNLHKNHDLLECIGASPENVHLAQQVLPMKSGCRELHLLTSYLLPLKQKDIMAD
jgi:hypothetical protein